MKLCDTYQPIDKTLARKIYWAITPSPKTTQDVATSYNVIGKIDRIIKGKD